MPNGAIENLESTDEVFGVTDNAAARINTLLGEELDADNKFMRIAVEGGGCSGFQYIFKFDTYKNDDDLTFNKNGIDVVVDAVSLELLNGGVLDYTEELIGSYFQVINPNASSACGCGTSFSI